MSEDPKHPMQPLVAVDQANSPHGPVIRFKKNKIVDWLERAGGANLNEISLMHANGMFPTEDMEQFWQLLGYSVSGYCDISFVRDEVKDEAHQQAEALYAAVRKERGLE